MERLAWRRFPKKKSGLREAGERVAQKAWGEKYAGQRKVVYGWCHRSAKGLPFLKKKGRSLKRSISSRGWGRGLTKAVLDSIE